MNSRERVLAAVSHREPDRVPFDLGSTVVTGIHIRAYERLRSILGLQAEETIVLDRIQQLAMVSDDVIEALGVDVKGVYSSPGAGWQFAPQEDDGYRHFTDEFGVGWRMPVDGGFYYDMVAHPLAGDCSRADVAKYPLLDPVDPGRFVGLRDHAERIAYRERRATIGKSLCAGIMETAAWLRGYEDFYADLAADPGLASALMHRILELKIAYWGAVIDACGPALDIACEADDLGSEHSMLVSPVTYRTLLKPLHRELFDYLHTRGVRVFFHSCGAIRPIIGDLIDSGVDILNPVQVAAAGMDSVGLKAEFGRDVTFWGGGVDTQRVLPFGSPDEVRAEVRRRLGDMMPGGGFVFNTVHNIQPDVPAENIVAMWETVRERGKYS